MDRGHGHRAILSVVVVGGLSWLASDGLKAQGASPALSATPWVQASPSASAVVTKPPRVVKSPGASSPVGLSKEEFAHPTARKREDELERQNELFIPGARAAVPPRLVLRLTPEENEAYQRNLALWRTLPLEKKDEIRGLVNERVKEETEKAYANSGLNLNQDQREVFMLRYRQERRRLEREIQEKAAAERTRRMPEIMDRLRQEFGPGSGRP